MHHKTHKTPLSTLRGTPSAGLRTAPASPALSARHRSGGSRTPISTGTGGGGGGGGGSGANSICSAALCRGHCGSACSSIGSRGAHVYQAWKSAEGVAGVSREGEVPPLSPRFHVGLLRHQVGKAGRTAARRGRDVQLSLPHRLSRCSTVAVCVYAFVCV